MTHPARYDISLQRRADYSVLMEFKTSDDEPIDLTGWTVAAQAWDAARRDKYCDFTTEYVDRENGTVRLKLSYNQTIELPELCEYDVLVINGSGVREYYVEGKIIADPGYTAVS